MPGADEELTVVARMIDKISPQMAKINKKVSTGMSRMQASAQKVTGGFGNLASKVVNLKNALVAFVGVKIFQSLIGELADLGDTFDKTSQRLGVSTDFLQELSFQAELGGTSLSAMEAGIRKMAKTANDANAGLSTAVRSFGQLGIEVNDAGGELKSVEVLFRESTTALADMENETQKLAIAQEIFGRGGTQLLPILNQGSEAMKNQSDALRKMGGILDQEAIKATVDYKDSLVFLNRALLSIKIKFIIPIVRNLADAIQNFVDNGGAEKLERSFKAVILAAKTFFVIFAVNKIIAIGGAFIKASSGVSKLGMALKALPGIAIITAASVVIDKFAQKAEKAAGRFDTMAGALGDAVKVKELIKLREEFDRLKKSGEDTTIIYGRWGQQILKVSPEMEKINKQTKSILGFTFENEQAQGQTLKYLTAIAEAQKTVIEGEEKRKKKKVEDAGPSPEIKADQEKQLQELAAFQTQTEQLKTSFRARTLAGELENLNLQQTSLINSAQGFRDKNLIDQQEFEAQKLAIEQEFLAKRQDLGMKHFQQQEALRGKEKNTENEAKSQQEFRDKTIANGKRQLTDAVISQSDRGLKLFIKNEKTQKKISLATSIIQGALAVQRTLAAPPFFPATLPAALAVGAMAAVNTATIATQAFAKGGFPKGQNAMVRVNEQGQESILNAGATNRLGPSGVNALNSGIASGGGVSNEISYSPTFNISGTGAGDLIDVLREDKERFAEFFQEDIVERGYL